MLFSSLIFLYAFLPLVLLLYYLTPAYLKNGWLLLASLVFFAWGGVSYTIILISVILLNYVFGRLIYSSKTPTSRKYLAAAGITLNILLLGTFKYSNFLSTNLDHLFKTFDLGSVIHTNIILPIGISFYTFHCISYLVDVYRGKTSSESNLANLALYVGMFPQLVAGPIVRYHDIQNQILHRKHSLTKFVSGVISFTIGLGKKVLLANNFAAVCSHAFFLEPATLNPYIAWLGIICYAFQIYCDFSGYSDMAIGLGRMFGFEFKENFNFPFISKSVTEFWRRWHISLSSWFNDYVYTPIVIAKRDWNKGSVVFALLVTFLLCGIWHGAGWNFALYGLMHGLMLVLEFLTKKQRKGLGKIIPAFLFNGLATFYTFSFVAFSWIFFKIPDFHRALDFIAALFRPSQNDWQKEFFFSLIDIEFVLTFTIALLGSFGILNQLAQLSLKLLKKSRSFHAISYARIVFNAVTVFFTVGILFLCTLYLLAGTYNPFIYYQF